MKNAYDWFSQLTPQDASCARGYINQEKFDNLYSTLREALMYAFTWEDTVQGRNYWKRIADNLK